MSCSAASRPISPLYQPLYLPYVSVASSHSERRSIFESWLGVGVGLGVGLGLGLEGHDELHISPYISLHLRYISLYLPNLLERDEGGHDELLELQLARELADLLG